MTSVKFVPLFVVITTLCSFSLVYAAVEYEPLFSPEQLDAATLEQRTRMVAMDRQNRKRWERREGHTEAQSTGGVYRYRDKNGNVQFSDRPGPGGQRVEVATPRPDEDTRRAAEKRVDEQQRMIRALQESRRMREEIRVTRAEEAERKELQSRECRRVLNDIQDFRRGGVAYYELDDNGERKFFNDQEISAKVGLLETSYREHCGDLPELAQNDR